MELKPETIIQAFDEVREFIFGYEHGRDNPHKDDQATAAKWIDDGLKLVVAVIVFTEQMHWMHERFLSHGRDREFLPASLEVFDSSIERAIRKSRDETLEGVIWQWGARYRAWKKNGFWLEDHWGPKPLEPGCRVPKSVIQEMKASA